MSAALQAKPLLKALELTYPPENTVVTKEDCFFIMRAFINVYNIPFDYALLDSKAFKPDIKDIEIFGEEQYQKALDEYNEMMGKELFKNVYVNYESCDCGGGYPCSHGDYPVEIYVGAENASIDGENKPHHFEIEDEIYSSRYTPVSYEAHLPKTIGEFIDDCYRAGMNLLWSEAAIGKYFSDTSVTCKLCGKRTGPDYVHGCGWSAEVDCAWHVKESPVGEAPMNSGAGITGNTGLGNKVLVDPKKI